jgi:hypothetical protein
MLNDYIKYLNGDLNETINHVKPDPPGASEIYRPKSYKDEFTKIMNDAYIKAKKDSSDEMIKVLKERYIGKLISTYDNNGRQKILMVNDVIEGKSGNDYYPILFEDDKKQLRYCWDHDNRSNIYRVDKFLDSFEEYYIDQLIMFQGRPVKGGQESRYIKHIIKIGIHNGAAQDSIIVEADDKTQQLLNHTQPIKILDMKLKELDPFGEENWDR